MRGSRELSYELQDVSRTKGKSFLLEVSSALIVLYSGSLKFRLSKCRYLAFSLSGSGRTASVVWDPDHHFANSRTASPPRAAVPVYAIPIKRLRSGCCDHVELFMCSAPVFIPGTTPDVLIGFAIGGRSAPPPPERRGYLTKIADTGSALMRSS